MKKNTEKVLELKAIIDERLSPLINQDYLYLDVPYHANLGDTLIWQGTLDFLKTLPYKCLYSSWYNGDKYKDVATKNPNSLIILHGGGEISEMYGWNVTSFAKRL